MLSSRVSGPILRLVRLWQYFQETAVSVERLGDIFNSVPEPYADSSKLRLPISQIILNLNTLHLDTVWMQLKLSGTYLYI